MPRLTQEKHFQEASRRVHFCYLCSQSLVGTVPQNREHVVPLKIFDVKDRTCTLVLPAHTDCNSRKGKRDEEVVNFLKVLTRRIPTRHFRRNRFQLTQWPGQQRPFLSSDIPLNEIVWGWVLGFHAALYNDYLAADTPAAVYIPFQRANNLDGKLLFEDIKPQQFVICEELAKNARIDNVDLIRGYSGKLLYDCVWIQFVSGQWMCVFGLRIYHWETLNDKRFARRGCVGFYVPANGKPADARTGTRLAIPLVLPNRLDPFA